MRNIVIPTAEQKVSSDVAVNSSMPIRRIASVDVYRGFVMLLMMAEALSFETVSLALPGNSFWRFLSFNQTHVAWSGCSLHDLIQPSFTFLVGVVLPFSIAGRLSKGATFGNLLKHAIIRSIILVCLGILLHSRNTSLTFIDTLTQIGLGYTFLFILGFYSQRVQVIALIVILAAYWFAFALYPLPDGTFNYRSVGISPDWEHNFHGFAAHWNMNTNLSWSFDRWLLQHFPGKTPFVVSRINDTGGYATLSFIPTLGTMILGLFAGNALISSTSPNEKIKFFVTMGLCLFGLGILLHITGINPIVKRIWTPAWTIFSGGICFLLLTFFYSIIDVSNKKKWSFFLMIIGINSIAAYVIADGGLNEYIINSLYFFLGQNFDLVFGSAYATLVKGSMVLLLDWLILYWMYKRKIFIKI